MKLKSIVEEDFINYKKPSMFLIFPTCTFKCCLEYGCDVCQNMEISNLPDIEVKPQDLVDRYMNNSITKSVVCGGLEPFDSFRDLMNFVYHLRKRSNDDIVIYTGYEEYEIEDKLEELRNYKNIIVKFGRFIPDSEHRFDDVLGVELASNNQYAKQLY